MGAQPRYPLRSRGSFGVALLFALLTVLVGTEAQQPTEARQPEPREQWIRMADIFQALGLPRKDQVDKHVIAPDFVEADVAEAGFEIVDRRDEFITRPQDEDFFWLIIARRPR